MYELKTTRYIVMNTTTTINNTNDQSTRRGGAMMNTSLITLTSSETMEQVSESSCALRTLAVFDSTSFEEVTKKVVFFVTFAPLNE